MGSRKSASVYRHRIRIERRLLDQQNESGDMVPSYELFADRVPAGWEPLSVTEFMAAAADQSQIKARCVIRYMAGLLPNMRILYEGVYYDPQGFLSDKESGRDYITIPVSQSLSQTP